MESSAWIRTADGSIQEVEHEVAIACPRICHEMKSGLGSSKNNPITLPRRIKPTTLNLVIDYCRFHLGRHSSQVHKSFDENFFQKDARSLLELLSLSNYLQLGLLLGSTKKAMAQKISNKSTEEICHMLKLTVDLSECGQAEKSNLRECCDNEIRRRLLEKLYSNRRESLLKKVEHLKDFVKPRQDIETRKVDDLVSFINGDGGTFLSSVLLLLLKPILQRKSLKRMTSCSANPCGSSSDTIDLLGTQDESFNVNEDAVYDNLDPVKDAETTRAVILLSVTRQLLDIMWAGIDIAEKSMMVNPLAPSSTP
ncbi:Skp1 domain-containing protein [Heracleum sosnowskyi]|uniref:Skp1 domain-containing protein n=1 Tax=Heracleum sosnowskyi TaxID=360622 RepID=A0AAD8MM85_9APIA|nr:Skp1 domain-containing protein [Heracleum sosnowskyi]